MDNDATFNLNGCCPRCGYKFDAATSITGTGGPEQGDFSVCINCAGILRYSQHLQMTIPTDEHFKEMSLTDPDHFLKLFECQMLVRRQIRARAQRN